MGLGSTTPFMPYSVRWRGQRRVLQQYFSPQAIEMYQSIQQQQVHISLQDLLSAPDLLESTSMASLSLSQSILTVLL